MELQHGETRGAGPLMSSRAGTNAPRRKTKDRLNDQTVPKPSSVNMGEKMLKVAVPKQHPYASHMSRFAMFPSFKCPDDPDTGVRASSFLGPHVPKAAAEVNVLGKAIGGPYRLEVLESAAGHRENAPRWTGDHGFWDCAKSVSRESQVWYPTPPKTILPNPKLRDWDLTLSERTGNMLKNLERALWITSYQSHYTGSGPARPLQIDDFREKISDPYGMSSHAAPLRERSQPGFIPSKPRKGRRHERVMQLNPSLNHQHRCRSPEITARSNEAPVPNKLGHSISQGPVEEPSSGFPQEVTRHWSSEGCNDLARRLDPQQLTGSGEELSHKSGLLPRPPVLPGIPQLDRTDSVNRLQHSFSKSEAHRRFNGSTTRPLVNLNDNVATGRKHDFYGVNCNFLH